MAEAIIRGRFAGFVEEDSVRRLSPTERRELRDLFMTIWDKYASGEIKHAVMCEKLKRAGLMCQADMVRSIFDYSLALWDDNWRSEDGSFYQITNHIDKSHGKKMSHPLSPRRKY